MLCDGVKKGSSSVAQSAGVAEAHRVRSDAMDLSGGCHSKARVPCISAASASVSVAGSMDAPSTQIHAYSAVSAPPSLAARSMCRMWLPKQMTTKMRSLGTAMTLETARWILACIAASSPTMLNSAGMTTLICSWWHAANNSDARSVPYASPTNTTPRFSQPNVARIAAARYVAVSLLV